MKFINKLALTISKALEILHWFGVFLLVISLITSITAKDWLSSVLSKGAMDYGTEISTYGFEITATDSNGVINMTAITLFSITGIIIFSLMAMIFRNVYLIIKTSKGKTWFAKGNTPFQKDITRMLKEIGIFFISVPVTGLIMSIISRIIIGVEQAEISVNIENFIIGILILCLTQFFTYGEELQQEVDGLL